MIDVSTELKTAFLSDSTHKDVEIEFETSTYEPPGFTKVNFLKSYLASSLRNDTASATVPVGGQTISLSTNLESFISTDDINAYVKYANYISVDFDVLIQLIEGDFSSFNVTVQLQWSGGGTTGYHAYTSTTMDFDTGSHTVWNHVSGKVYLDPMPTIYGHAVSIPSIGMDCMVSGPAGESYTSGEVYYEWKNLQINLIRSEEEYDLAPYGIENTTQTQRLQYNTKDYIKFDLMLANFYTRTNYADKYTIGTGDFIINNAYGLVYNAWSGSINTYVPYANYLRISVDMCIDDFTFENESLPLPQIIVFGTSVRNTSGQTLYNETNINFNDMYQLQPSGTLYPLELFVSLEDVVRLSWPLYISFRPRAGSYYDPTEKANVRYTITNVHVQLGYDTDSTNYLNDIQLDYQSIPVADFIAPVTSQQSLPVLHNSDLTLESLSLSESLSNANVLKFGATEAALCEFDTTGLNDYDEIVGKYFRLSMSCDGFSERIPLGRFRVGKVTKRGAQDIVIKHIEAYDGIYPLSMNGLNWYNNYMGVLPNFLAGDHNTYHVARQMFSSLYNITKNLNIDLGIKNIDYSTLTLNDVSSAWAGEIILKYRTGYDINPYDYVRCAVTIANTPVVPSTGTKVYKVDIGYDYTPELDEYFEDIGFYHDQFGMYPSRGGVIIWQILNDNSYEFFTVNDGDWFTLNPNTVYYYVCIPAKYHIWIGDEDNLRLREMTMTYPETIGIYTGDFDLFSSDNLSVSLVYYNWKTGEVGNPGNVTLRDIIRSLVEITGYFFRYGRDGEIEFTNCDLAGLYPSETLYPSDDLYPRGNDFTEYLAKSKYRYFECDDKETNHFGKIQVVLQSVNENEPASKLYVGSEANRNTYIIDDNVFYCASGVSYALDVDGTDPLPEVTTMLSNLYNQIKSVYYVPCEVEAVGMPWFECGDRIAVFTKMGGFETFIFRRRLKGIHNLVDTYGSLGEEQTESVIEEWR